MTNPSQKLIDFTVECEVSSRAYYEKRLQRPEWPGGRSGVTWAIGYDGGYADKPKLQRDWQALVDSAAYNAMGRCLGVTGGAAHALLPQVRSSILIPWDLAMKVFIEADVPEYMGQLRRAIPEVDSLPPDCIGVLFSVGYNRGNGGWNSTNDRFREMHAIKQHIKNGELDMVSVELRKMTRLWPSDDPKDPDRGLRMRRNKEAELWDKGLKNSGPAAETPVVKPNPPRQMPPQPQGKAEAGAGTGTVIAGGSVVKDAHDAKVDPVIVIIIIGAVFVAALVAMKLVNMWRTSQNPVLARSAREPEVIQAVPPKAA